MLRLSKIKKYTLFLLLFVFSVFLAKNALAYTSTGNYQEAFEKSVYGTNQINQPSFSNETLQAIVAGLNNQLLGCLTPDCSSKIGASGGAVGSVSNLVTAMYSNPPASGTRYLADLGKNLGVVQPAYAATGFGFTKLDPILPVWKAFRNIAYIFFTIIFVVIGFAIMFRLKISPQAVVTIQAAIPRIVLALILVTFSYAIAGLLVDLSYVIILLVIAFLGSQGVPSIGMDDVPGLQEQFTGGFEAVLKGVAQVVGFGLPFTFAALGGIIGAIVGAFAGGIGALPGAVLGVGLFLLIIGVTVLYLVFKLFMELLKAYLGIIFAIILGPLQIMLGAIPGQSGFGGWIKGLLANILIFPAVAIFLLLGRVLMKLSTEDLWTPPMFSFPGTVGLNLLGQQIGPQINILSAIMGLGVLLMVTKVPDMVRDAFKVPAFKYGSAIGEALAPVTGATKAAIGIGKSSAETYARQWIPDLPKREKKSASATATREPTDSPPPQGPH